MTVVFADREQYDSDISEVELTSKYLSLFGKKNNKWFYIRVLGHRYGPHEEESPFRIEYTMDGTNHKIIYNNAKYWPSKESRLNFKKAEVEEREGKIIVVIPKIGSNPPKPPISKL